MRAGEGAFLSKSTSCDIHLAQWETTGREMVTMVSYLSCFKSPLLLALCLGGLLGCVQQTYYSPAANGYGYAERKIGPERYQVVFAGNHKTRRETTHQYVLFRAAQLADREGFKYVAVNDKSQRIERYGDLRSRPTQRVDLGLEDGYGGPGGFGRNRSDKNRVRSTVERYQAILDVSFYNDRESVPAEAREVYQTDTVLAELAKTIEFEDEPRGGNYITDQFSLTGRR